MSPATPIIDITHLVPPGDVRRGAAVLAQTVPYLPAGVHVAVVDPGVGTKRRAIALAAGEHVFVGPDNGVLSWAAKAAAAAPEAGAPASGAATLGAPFTEAPALEAPAPGASVTETSAAGDGEPRRAYEAYELTNAELWLEPVSATFHGRDVFAPVAAHLVNGMDIAAVGDEVDLDTLVTLPQPTRRIREGGAEGEVLTVDRFGNVQLSIEAADLDRVGVRLDTVITVTLGRRRLSVAYRRTFGSVPAGDLVAYLDSAGCVALAVNGGNAAQRLGLPPGAHVRITEHGTDQDGLGGGHAGHAGPGGHGRHGDHADSGSYADRRAAGGPPVFGDPDPGGYPA